MAIQERQTMIVEPILDDPDANRLALKNALSTLFGETIEEVTLSGMKCFVLPKTDPQSSDTKRALLVINKSKRVQFCVGDISTGIIKDFYTTGETYLLVQRSTGFQTLLIWDTNPVTDGTYNYLKVAVQVVPNIGYFIGAGMFPSVEDATNYQIGPTVWVGKSQNKKTGDSAPLIYEFWSYDSSTIGFRGILHGLDDYARFYCRLDSQVSLVLLEKPSWKGYQPVNWGFISNLCIPIRSVAEHNYKNWFIRDSVILNLEHYSIMSGAYAYVSSDSRRPLIAVREV